jgi:type II secretory pathway pseudopilin PulG
MDNPLLRLLSPQPMQYQQGSGAMPVMQQPQMQPQQMAPNKGMNFMRDLVAGALLSYGGAGVAPVLAGQQQRRRREEEMFAQQQEQQRQNQTAAYFRDKDPELAKAIELGVIDGRSAMSIWQQKQQGQEPVQEQFGLNPIYGTDPETGKTVLGTIGNRGTFKPIDTGGFEVANGIDKVDLGTHFGLLDKRTGQMVGTLPKENYQEAFDAARGGKEGTEVGADTSLLKSMESKMPGLEAVVVQLEGLADTATYTQKGQLGDAIRREAGMPSSEGAIARAKYIATVDNQVLPMLKDTFGAAFTVAEGESLRATLGDPNKSPEEKKAVLRAFIAQKRRDVAALQTRTEGAPAPAQTGAGVPDPLGIR